MFKEENFETELKACNKLFLQNFGELVNNLIFQIAFFVNLEQMYHKRQLLIVIILCTDKIFEERTKLTDYTPGNNLPEPKYFW